MHSLIFQYQLWVELINTTGQWVAFCVDRKAKKTLMLWIQLQGMWSGPNSFFQAFTHCFITNVKNQLFCSNSRCVSSVGSIEAM